MDPQAAFERWKAASFLDAIDAAEALQGWLRAGGFEPDWALYGVTPSAARAFFFEWCRQHTHDDSLNFSTGR